MRDSDLLADLPPPDDFEPPSLRDDIRDELEDHLQCAFRREVLRDGDEPAARTRVLSRFGDPKQLARRLWWQAMWSRVMGRKLLAGLQWMVTLAAVFAAGAVYVTNSRILNELETARTEDQRSTASLAHELQELRHQVALAQNQADGRRADGQPGATDGPPGAPVDAAASAVPPDSAAKKPSLTVQLVDDREGRPPVEDPVKEIKLIGGGNVYEGVPERLGAAMPGKPGRYVVASPGGERYDLVITLADGQTSRRNILVRDDLPREMTVVCPEPLTKVAVSITSSPWPRDLQEARVQGWCKLFLRLKQRDKVVVEGVEWRSPGATDQQVEFDDAGQVTQLACAKKGEWTPTLSLVGASADDRRIVLMNGPVDVQWAAGLPSPEALNTEPASRTVKPGEDHWELEIPEELIARMREVLADAKKAGN